MVICLERGADLHMAQLMPLPLTFSCSSKIQIGFTFLVRLTWVVPDKVLLNRCVCVCVCVVWHNSPLSVCVCHRCLCLSQVRALSKQLNGLRCFLALRFSLIYPTLCYKEIWLPPKLSTFLWKLVINFLWNFVPNSGLSKFARPVDCCNVSSSSVDS